MLNPIVRSTAKILRRNYTMKIRNKTASIATAKLRRLLHGTSQRHEQVNITNTGIGITIGDRVLHPLWLRERSTSSKSVQKVTKQPIFQPHEIDIDIKIDNADIVNDDILYVKFSDGYTTAFNIKKLIREIESFNNSGIQVEDLSMPLYEIDRESTRQPKRYHLEDFMQKHYNDAGETNISFENTNPSVKIEALETLMKDGHFILEGVPSESGMVEKIGNAITGSKVRPTNWGDYFNVQNKPDGDKKDIAYTAEGLPPHVDNPYRDPSPMFQLLHTLENDCEGGDSTAVDGFGVAMELKQKNKEYFDLLTSVGVRWENDGGTQTSALYCISPHIKLDSSGKIIHQIYYSPKSGGYAPYLPPDDLDKFFKARWMFAKMLNEEKRIASFRLKKGDVWIFNNMRILHGRTAFNPSGKRHLQGSYIDVDGVQHGYFHAKHRIKNAGKETPTYVYNIHDRV